MEVKKCKKCNAKKPLSEFYKCKNCVDGLNTRCIDCVKSANTRPRFYGVKNDPLIELLKFLPRRSHG